MNLRDHANCGVILNFMYHKILVTLYSVCGFLVVVDGNMFISF